MKIVVFGGDGFCGWPSALKLSNSGHEVLIVDNFSRRKIEKELNAYSLTPIKPLPVRIKTWEKISGRKIKYKNIDISKDYKSLKKLFSFFKPHAVVHFAEQRSAPYSMKSKNHKSFTINNNLLGTNNILDAIVETNPKIHLVHLGTTGYYGYSNIGLKIPEGYLNLNLKVKNKSKKLRILYPPSPGSIYHLTKCQDALMFQFYSKNDKLRITDLHQGIVWGTQTNETKLHKNLVNRFDYDGIFGTVLNRFLVQSQIGHPLTIYGSGGQTRAFIHIQNSAECVRLAVENPPKKNGNYRILNQTTECHNIKQLAEKVRKITNSKIKFYKNQRVEAAKNSLDFVKEGLIRLGLKPIYLDQGLMGEIIENVKKYKKRINSTKVISKSLWSRDKVFDKVGRIKAILK